MRNNAKARALAEELALLPAVVDKQKVVAAILNAWGEPGSQWPLRRFVDVACNRVRCWECGAAGKGVMWRKVLRYTYQRWKWTYGGVGVGYNKADQGPALHIGGQPHYHASALLCYKCARKLRSWRRLREGA